jgi:hypothetical protein
MGPGALYRERQSPKIILSPYSCVCLFRGEGSTASIGYKYTAQELQISCSINSPENIIASLP